MKIVISCMQRCWPRFRASCTRHLQRTVNPTPFGLNHGIEFLFVAVVGGIKHVWGAVLGAVILMVLQDWLQSLLPKLLGENGNFFKVIVFGVLMVLLLQYARNGVWPIIVRFLPRSRRAQAPQSVQPPLPQRAKPTAGELRPTRGEIAFRGQCIDRLRSHDIVKRGIGRTFHVKLPSTMTVARNCHDWRPSTWNDWRMAQYHGS
ncbi:branched-subunit amino acid transport system permease [Mycetohabitans endofungorum]|uniref:Branched-subunit amino acid transport system permease n=1 Tax=Mycetohabitans endofungorum TaxID=417203 RepID=A0A2P5K8K2_9BURK|nr:branched-subunit amino acid transport system permease [Mycetohabitans endofungorum]